MISGRSGSAPDRGVSAHRDLQSACGYPGDLQHPCSLRVNLAREWGSSSGPARLWRDHRNRRNFRDVRFDSYSRNGNGSCGAAWQRRRSHPARKWRAHGRAHFGGSRGANVGPGGTVRPSDAPGSAGIAIQCRRSRRTVEMVFRRDRENLDLAKIFGVTVGRASACLRRAEQLGETQTG